MTTIGICGRPLSAGLRATFDALGKALGVSFEERALGHQAHVSAWIVLGAGRQMADAVDRSARPCYVVVEGSESVPCSPSSSISFSRHAPLPAILRAREVTADDAVGARALPGWLADATPQAFKDGAPIWAHRNASGGGHHYVTLAPPELRDDDALFMHFSGSILARLLPLVLFVKGVSGDRGWDPPPLQAAFMFDDPNLHWTSYGFLDFAEMVRRAAAGNYHIAVATIPLDAWFVHPAAGDIFRQSTGRVSLLYHGNDHLSRELARPCSAFEMQQLLGDALTRIGTMESRDRLQVARVMTPPHGACSELAIRQMGLVGYEAVCVSRGSLRHYNPGVAWTRTIGMQVCDMVSGLPVIPRFGLTSNSRNDILIAALLRQPIVPMTHHQALADGYGLLDETAGFVNSLGPVAWRDMRSIARSLFSHKHEGDTMRVKMWTKRLTVTIPRGTTRIEVLRPWLDQGARESVRWRLTGAPVDWTVAPNPDVIQVPGGVDVEIASVAAARGAVDVNTAGRHRVAPVVRRMLTETRDRVLPPIHRIIGAGRRWRAA